MPSSVLQESLTEIVATTTDITWSVSIRDAAGLELATCNADTPMRTASVGKLLLLTEVARQCNTGQLTGRELLGRDPELFVAGAGMWQHLHVDELPLHDLCVLVAGCSDNLATNALLKHIGFESLHHLGDALGLSDTSLLDYVRDQRGPDDVQTLSVGSATQLSYLMTQLANRELLSAAVSDQLNAWLATGADLSMVASAFGLDPLAHVETEDRDYCIRNKTGSDNGIRADVGTIARNGARLSYAIIANWQLAEKGVRDTVLSTMNTIGKMLRGNFFSD